MVIKSIDQSAARALLEPYHERLAACVARAWTRTVKVAALFNRFSDRCSANVMHESIREELRLEFDSDPSVVVLEPRVGTDRFFLRMRDLEVLLQFKKLDREGRPQNYPTRTARLFNLQLGLPGIGQAVRVTIGYSLNRAKTDIVDLLALRTRGSGTAWSYSIIDAIQSTGPAPALLIPTTAASPSRGRRFRPKRQPDPKDGSGTAS